MKLKVALLAAMACVGIAAPAKADSTRAHCDYYPKGEDYAEVSIGCTFSQFQGNVYIDWDDGVKNAFRQLNDGTGRMVDKRGGVVTIEEGGLGKAGLIYRLENGSIYVYWR